MHASDRCFTSLSCLTSLNNIGIGASVLVVAPPPAPPTAPSDGDVGDVCGNGVEFQ